MAYTEEELKKELESQEYQYGFTTDIDSETFPVGLNEDIVKAISKKKNEPEWMTQWRLEAYSSWKDMKEPNWHNVKYKKPDFQAISYFSAPKTNKYKSLDEVDPELIKTFNKLGISIEEQKKLAGVAVVSNISDICAMNGICKQITVSIAVSNRFKLETLNELYEGINLACKRYKVDLVGGDTTSSQKGLIISVTAMGVVDDKKICQRSGAKNSTSA